MSNEQNGEVSQEKKSMDRLINKVNGLIKTTSSGETTKPKKHQFTLLTGKNLFRLIEK